MHDYFGDEPVDLVAGEKEKDGKEKSEKKDKEGYSAVPNNDDDDMPEILDQFDTPRQRQLPNIT